MSDILNRLRLRQSRIVDGTMHTCSDTCTHPDCLAVASLHEIERLRGLLREVRDAEQSCDIDSLITRIDAALADTNVPGNRVTDQPLRDPPPFQVKFKPEWRDGDVGAGAAVQPSAMHSCRCPAGPGQDCPLTESECRERAANPTSGGQS